MTAPPGDREAGGARLSIVQILEKGSFTTGSVVQMYQLAHGLAGRGHRVTIVTRPGVELAARAREQNLDVAALPLRHELDLASAFRLARLYGERRVDVVHAHKGIAHSVALAATFLSRRRPVIVANRGVSFPLDLFNRWKYRVRLGAAVAVCEDIRRVVVSTGGVPAEKVHVVYAGVDLSRFDPAKADRQRVRREWGIGPDEILLVQVSAREYKGWRDLLAGAARLTDELPRVKVALVACESDAQKARVAEAARALGIGDRVLPIGFRADMPDVLASADVVADMSWGGLGITGTLREAMAMGRPVIASSAGGNPELVEDGVSGLLVPPRDPEAFAAALERLVREPSLAGRLAAAGRARVAAHFSAEARLDRIEALYRRLAGERQDLSGERARAAGKSRATERDR